MRVILVGPPGSGKTALAALIGKDFGLPVLTVAEVLANCAQKERALSAQVAQYLKAGQCVPDGLVLLAMNERLAGADVAEGFVLEGYPLNAGQAEELERFLAPRGQHVDIVIHLKVDSDVLMERLVGQARCDNCGMQYNLYVNPPMVEGVCDNCGARIIQRPGDYEETISNRLRIFAGLIGPLLQYYKVYGRLIDIDGGDEPKAVYRRLKPELKRVSLEASEPRAPSPSEEKAADLAARSGGKTASKVKKSPAPKRVAAKKKAAKAAAKKKAAKKVAKKRAVSKAAETKTGTKSRSAVAKKSPKVAKPKAKAGRKATKKAGTATSKKKAAKKASPKKPASVARKKAPTAKAKKKTSNKA